MTFSKQVSEDYLVFQADEDLKQIEEESKDEVNSKLYINFNTPISEQLTNRGHKKTKSKTRILPTLNRGNRILYIQMQICKQETLKQWLNKRNRVVEKHEVLAIFKQIVEGLRHIHHCNLIHRDLTPGNIFFHDGVIKIGDFGLSKESTSMVPIKMQTPRGAPNRAGRNHTTGIGTPFYTSPEQDRGYEYNEKVDIYALGIIFLEMFHPFTTAMERTKILSQLRSKILPPYIFENYPEESKFILSLTNDDHTQRPSCSEILKLHLLCGNLNTSQLGSISQYTLPDHLIVLKVEVLSESQLKNQTVLTSIITAIGKNIATFSTETKMMHQVRKEVTVYIFRFELEQKAELDVIAERISKLSYVERVVTPNFIK